MYLLQCALQRKKKWHQFRVWSWEIRTQKLSLTAIPNHLQFRGLAFPHACWSSWSQYNSSVPGYLLSIFPQTEMIFLWLLNLPLVSSVTIPWFPPWLIVVIIRNSGNLVICSFLYFLSHIHGTVSLIKATVSLIKNCKFDKASLCSQYVLSLSFGVWHMTGNQ